MLDPVQPVRAAGLLAAAGRRFVVAAVRVLVPGALALGAACLLPTAPQARSVQDASATQAGVVRMDDLPSEARDLHRRILRGGPFRYPDKDGAVFGNRERLLPRETRGYYREYTVPTPGSRDRGARRLVCGGQEPRTPDVCYYTQDHYASFRRIAP